MVYGYVRVSTKDQNAARQISALMNEGVDEKNLFVDRKSGKDFQRKRYKSLLRKIKPGDVIFIKELDRLGRNYTEIIENWRLITVEKQTDIVVLDMPLLDTRKCGNDLTGRFIDDLVLQILSYVAETERRNMLISHEQQYKEEYPYENDRDQERTGRYRTVLSGVSGRQPDHHFWSTSRRS